MLDTTLSPAVIELVEEAFEAGCEPMEICAYAGISMDEYTRLIAQNIAWYNRALLSAHMPFAKAKVNFVSSIKGGNVQDSLTLLERRRSEDWAGRQKVDHEGKLEWNVTVAPFLRPPATAQEPIQAPPQADALPSPQSPAIIEATYADVPSASRMGP